MDNIMEKIADIGVVIFISYLPVILFVIAPIMGIWEAKFPKSWQKIEAFWIRHEALQKIAAIIGVILCVLALFGAGMHMEVPQTTK